VARRIARDGRISPLYATLGPMRSATLRYCGGDRDRAQQMHTDWRGWFDRYAAEWAKGRAVPPPPHNDTLGAHWARPTS
jgi:hypothetical protein